MYVHDNACTWRVLKHVMCKLPSKCLCNDSSRVSAGWFLAILVSLLHRSTSRRPVHNISVCVMANSHIAQRWKNGAPFWDLDGEIKSTCMQYSIWHLDALCVIDSFDVTRHLGATADIVLYLLLCYDNGANVNENCYCQRGVWLKLVCTKEKKNWLPNSAYVALQCSEV